MANMNNKLAATFIPTKLATQESSPGQTAKTIQAIPMTTHIAAYFSLRRRDRKSETMPAKITNVKTMKNMVARISPDLSH
jgi:hypothetical protein